MFIRGRFEAEMSEPEDFAVSKKICMLKLWCFFRQFVAFFLPIDLHVHVCCVTLMQCLWGFSTL